MNSHQKSLTYTLKRSKRARRVRLLISSGEKIVLVLPVGVPEKIAHNFFLAKEAWVIDKLKHRGFFKALSLDYCRDRKDYLRHKLQAKELLTARVEHFNQEYNYSYNNISVKNQKTRWGSCSRSGNLNFNYKLLFLPPAMRDYVVVHELCHLKEFNHSPVFWSLVGQTFPDYRDIRRKFKHLTL